MTNPTLIDLLDEWIALDDAWPDASGDGRDEDDLVSISPLLADPQKLGWYLTGWRVTRLMVIGGYSAATSLIADISSEDSVAAKIAATMVGPLDRFTDLVRETREYEVAYGGVGEGPTGYARGERALMILDRLAEDLLHYGESDTAMAVTMCAAGLSSLPSWIRAQESVIESIFSRLGSDVQLRDEDFLNPLFLLYYPYNGLGSIEDDLERAKSMSIYVEEHWTYYDSNFLQFLIAYKKYSAKQSSLQAGTETRPSKDSVIQFSEDIYKLSCAIASNEFIQDFVKTYQLHSENTSLYYENRCVNMILRKLTLNDVWFIDALETKINSGDYGSEGSDDEMKRVIEALPAIFSVVGTMIERGFPRSQIYRQINILLDEERTKVRRSEQSIDQSE